MQKIKKIHQGVSKMRHGRTDVRTDGWTDRRADGNNFIGPLPQSQGSNKSEKFKTVVLFWFDEGGFRLRCIYLLYNIHQMRYCFLKVSLAFFKIL